MEKVDIAPQIVAEKSRIADPAGLGLAGFALTTFMLSAFNAGWAQDFMWIGLAFFYGGLGQFMAGMWEFKRDNTFAATAFSTYGAFWMSMGLLVLLELLGVAPKGFDLVNALGWKLSAFFIFNLYMTACSLMTTMVVFAVFFLLSITECLLFIGFFCGGNNGWIKAGGYFGVFTAATAFYGSFAAVFNATAGRQIIFVGGPILKLNKL